MIQNTRYYWGTPARLLHWIGAAMIVLLFLHGLIFMDDDDHGRTAIWQMSLHASAGITLAVVMLARLLWRAGNETPMLPAGTPQVEEYGARAAHVALYLATFAVIATGWLMSGAFGADVVMKLFGLVDVPVGPAALPKWVRKVAEEAHEALAFLLVALAGLHAVAALWHHFVKRDSVMIRMIRGRKRQRRRDADPV